MIKLLKKLNKKEILFIVISFVFVVGQVWLDLKLPDYMSNITKLIMTPGNSIKDVLIQGGYMLLCAFGSLLSAFMVGYFAAYIGSSFSMKIRKEVFDKVEDFSTSEMKEFSTSSLISRTTNDVTQVQMFVVMGLQVMMKAPIMAVWAILKILGKSYEWSMITAVAVGVLIIMILVIVLCALPKFKIIQKLIDNINSIIRENLTGIRVVRAYNAEKYQEDKFDKANDKVTKTILFTQRIMSIMSPGMTFIMCMLTLMIYFVGANLINDAGMADKYILFSNMVVFSSYAVQVLFSFMMLTMIFIIFPRAHVSAKRILEVLDKDVCIKDGKGKKTKEVGTVEFKNVSFKYPDAEECILENISFKANKGDVVAFIGSTGSGKSTLINLVPRLYDVTSGEVLVDGVNVKDYKVKDLNNKLGYIPQRAVIFNGTIESNVKYGDNCCEEPSLNEVKEAVRVAQGRDFVEKLPDKYNSHVAQAGTNLSGGQKQRVAIARAIVRKPEIYIFDDSFSALDYKTDADLREELKKYTSDATSLIVAQRIGTIKNADLIVVLDKGKVVGSGTHEELLKSCDVYKEIAYSQLSKEELKYE